MDSIPQEINTIRIESGLGDCIVAAASVQRLARKLGTRVRFKTNSKIEHLFADNPDIILTYNSDKYTDLKWVSQYKEDNLYPLHTMQRFSTQLGFYIDPTDVVDLYDSSGKILNSKKDKTVLINQYSAEGNRRYIPDAVLEVVEMYCKASGYGIIHVGDCGSTPSVKDISSITSLMKTCKLFIGPVSFLYHLASAIRCDCVLFVNYMPEHKFSHFFNTTSVSPNRPCRFLCEENEYALRLENDCMSGCKAVNYREQDIVEALNKYL